MYKIKVNQSSGTSSGHVSVTALLDMAELHTSFTEHCPVIKHKHLDSLVVPQ